MIFLYIYMLGRGLKSHHSQSPFISPHLRMVYSQPFFFFFFLYFSIPTPSRHMQYGGCVAAAAGSTATRCAPGTDPVTATCCALGDF